MAYPVRIKVPFLECQTDMASDSDVYVVLGATGSVGRALAGKLSASGAAVIAAVRNVHKAEQVLAPLGITIRQIDAATAGSIDSCVESVAAEFGKLTGVANCIGSVLLKPAHLTTDIEWEETIATNLTTSFAVVRSSAKAMRQTGGSIVLCSSAAAKIGLANHEAIAAAKAGIMGLTLSAAASYATRGIRVNCVAPGLVKSEMTQKLWETEEAAARSSQMHATGRLGEPEEIAAAIEFLLTPQNSWITGQNLGVDGGLANVAPRIRA